LLVYKGLEIFYILENWNGFKFLKNSFIFCILQQEIISEFIFGMPNQIEQLGN
jgi:hypothetical protein